MRDLLLCAKHLFVAAMGKPSAAKSSPASKISKSLSLSYEVIGLLLARQQQPLGFRTIQVLQAVALGNDGERRQRDHDRVAVGLGARDIGVPDPAARAALQIRRGLGTA